MTTTTEWTKAKLVKYLLNGEAKITFTKSDGSNRIIFATLKESEIPAAEGKLGGDDKDHVIVWGINEKGWRTIIMSKIQKIEPWGDK